MGLAIAWVPLDRASEVWMDDFWTVRHGAVRSVRGRWDVGFGETMMAWGAGLTGLVPTMASIDVVSRGEAEIGRRRLDRRG